MESAKAIAKTISRRRIAPVVTIVVRFFIRVLIILVWAGGGLRVQPSGCVLQAGSKRSDLFHTHFVGSREFAALGERIGPLIANLCVHRNRRGNLLNGSVGLLYFDHGLGRLRLPVNNTVDSFGSVSFRTVGNKAGTARNVTDGLVFMCRRVAVVLRPNGPIQNLTWVNRRSFVQRHES